MTGAEMEEIRLWRVSGPKDSPTITDVSSIAQTQTEAMLEEILVKSPSLLANGLRLVGRQTETPGGPLDLLGIDEDGRLVIFELKRRTLTRDAVAQVLDYASYLSSLSTTDLNSLITDSSGKHGIDKIDDFTNWYQVSRRWCWLD
jgi:RecB family endonuclease NucS